MIEILTPAEIDRARDAGALVGSILQAMKTRATVGTNLLDIDRWAKQMIEDAGAESCYVDYAPSFGRGPFGHYICTAVNDAVLHGLPHDYALADGDLLTLDLAVTLRGISADAAISFIVGETQAPADLALIDATERALAAAIAVVRPGARSARCCAPTATRSTSSSAATASDRRCTRTRTSPTTDAPAAATSCARACCSRSSRGSWPTRKSS
jgi:methionyl aminopeptidase